MKPSQAAKLIKQANSIIRDHAHCSAILSHMKEPSLTAEEEELKVRLEKRITRDELELDELFNNTAKS